MAPNAGPVEEYDYEGLPPNFSVPQQLAAGAFAGIAEHTIMYPIDAIKTRMQILSSSPAGAHTGIVQRGMGMISKEGMSSLWRGMSSVALGAGPAHAIHFATYEAVKQTLGGNKVGEYHFVAAATSGASATIAADALMTPFDVVKQRMQLQGSRKAYNSMLDCAKFVYRAEGIRAFYVSYPTTLMTSIPFTSLQFLFYESAKTYLTPEDALPSDYRPVEHVLSGGFAGGLAAALTTPTDVVKTMLQTRGSATDPELRNVNGFMEGVRLLMKREGIRGLFKGVRPRAVAAIPSTAICWSAYEASKAYFVQQNDTNDGVTI